MKSIRPQIALSIFTLLSLLVATGCQPFQKSMTSEPSLGDASAPMYQIQIVPRFGRPIVERKVIKDKMTVQDALEESGAMDRFRSMDITLARLIEGRAPILKLPVEYRYDKQSVVDSQNYSLHPGDTISIKARPVASFDKLITALSSGLL